MIKKIFLWGMTLAGLAILLWICSLLIKSHDALKWPQTKGEVTSSLLTIDHLPKLIGFGADGLRWYGTSVQYEYTVDGGLYISNRLAIHDSGNRSPQAALNVMNKYRRHHQVTVYYDPKDYPQAVLEPANIGDIFVPFLIGGMLMILGLFFLNEQFLEINTRGRDSFLHQGNIYQNQGKLDEALNEYNKYIELGPSLANGYVCRGSLYLHKGSWDFAVADFNKAISIDPTDALVYFSRGNAYLGNKKYDKALQDMNKAMEMGFNVKPEILERINKGLKRETF